VVDTGCQGFLPQLAPGLRMLGRSLEDVRAILLTHGDGDHVGVAARLQKEGSQIPIHLNPADRYLVQKKRKKTEESMAAVLLKPGTWRLFGHFSRYGALNQPKIERTTDLAVGEELDLPGRPLAIEAPGHSEGHVVFHFPRHGALFAGDALCTWHPLSGERGPQPMAFNVSNGRAMASLSNFESIEAGLLLVGHGEPWTGGVAAAVERARARFARPPGG
jgi:glyoxylase-like metal-dependent hydrolase (beta-lactamase superfamily II)